MAEQSHVLIARALKGRKPSEVAADLGISRGHMGDLLSGRRAPAPVLAFKIERLLGVPAQKLNAELGQVLRKAAA